MAPQILVVDDETRYLHLIKVNLETGGYDVKCASNGEEALDMMSSNNPDLVILDIMMPKLDGFTTCERIRQFSNVPIIMLTAKGEEQDRVKGLNVGADDYVVKPFSATELVARVRAVLRRSRARPPAEAAAAASEPAGLQLDESTHQARLHGQPLDLTPVELRLLAALAAAPGRVFSRDQLLDRLHDDQRALSDRTVDSHVKNLRRKLERHGASPDAIRSIYGVGYRFEPEWLEGAGGP